MSLLLRLERYLAAADVSDGYADQLRHRLNSLVCFMVGLGIGEDELDPATITNAVNHWLQFLRGSGLGPHTVDGYRRAFLAVWNFAENPDPQHPPLRLRRIKKPRTIPQAYTHEQIRLHLSEAAKMRGRHPDNNWRADWWQAVLEAAYSTGLRRGDLLRLKWGDVSPTGRATVIQHKTGYPVHVRLSEKAMEHAVKLHHTRGLAFPWPYHMNIFSVTFKMLATKSGTGGSFKMYRKSAGSYAERDTAGAGSRLLGHRCESVFRVHYDDPTISLAGEVTPPPL